VATFALFISIGFKTKTIGSGLLVGVAGSVLSSAIMAYTCFQVLYQRLVLLKVTGMDKSGTR
jgi:hypothetical protein